MSPRLLALLWVSACAGDIVADAPGDVDTDAQVDSEVDLGPDEDHDGVPAAHDCDDANPLVRPGADEACNGADDDCDGTVDRDDAAFPGALGPFYGDHDVDGYGDASTAVWRCTAPDGLVAVAGDCDDADPNRRPGAAEICDAVDNDCDALVDGDDADLVYQSSPNAVFRYPDADGDGFGGGEGTWSCTDPGAGFVATAGDCDDARADVHPGVTEVWYDGIDEACDGGDDFDRDGDGHARAGSGDDCDDGSAAVHPGAAEVPYDGVDQDCVGGDRCDVDGDGALATLGACGGNDCDDGDAARAPGRTETCNGLDDDCDLLVDAADADVALIQAWADADGDGWGDPASTQSACTVPHGWARRGGDCDDTRDLVHPGAVESCDGRDDDCDLLVDDADGDVTAPQWGVDGDADGFPVASGLVRRCAKPGSSWVAWLGDADCDDRDDRTFPGVAFEESDVLCLTDADGDGWGDELPGSGVAAGEDCDDGRADVNPAAAEVLADGIDQDCDGHDLAGGPDDADGDGVTDDLDACGGGDDRVDANHDGRPDACGCTADGVITVALGPGWAAPSTFAALHASPPGPCPIDFVAYTSFTAAGLRAAGVDVLHLSDPAGMNLQYSASLMIEAHAWASSGGGFTGSYSFHYGAYDDTPMLVDLGIDPAQVPATSSVTTRLLGIVVPTHPVVVHQSALFEDSAFDGDAGTSSGYLAALLPGARVVALSSDWAGAIVVETYDGRRSVYFSALPEYSMTASQKQLMYDAFVWAASRVP